jgi:acetyl-CoA acetyltransferase family protein
MRVAIVGGVRTPFVKAAGVFSKYSALDLGKHVVVGCVEKLGLDPCVIEELYFGTVLLDPRIPNLAREILLRSGLPKTINGHFSSNNCITGLVAASAAVDAISSGRISCALVGGSESMSQPTLTFPRKGEQFFIRLAKARSMGAKLSMLSSFRPGFLAPQAPSPKEPSTGLTMGQHCELMAQEFKIGRGDQDRVAYNSHQSAAQARSAGFLAEQILPVGDVKEDNLIRPDTSLEALSSLKPVFDRSAQGSITAGNSSALTDGASAVCLMSEDLARKQGREILGFLDGVHFASVPPGDGLLMAPALALPEMLKRFNVGFQDIDLFEVHEAFAAQVLCNTSAWRDGWSRYPNVSVRGDVPAQKMNVAGGSIAIGHPFAATGGRLLLTICQALKQRGLKRGAISVCAAGGGAAAALVSAPG